MSIECLVWALEQGLPCAQKFVLAMLGDIANPVDRTCFPSQTTLAKKCGLSRQHVNVCLAELEEGGYISIMDRSRANGSSTSCLYRLNIPDMPESMKEVSPDVLGCVYVIAAEDGNSKIGVSRDVERRLKQLQGGSALKLSILKVWPMAMRRARRIERLAHANLKDCRLVGEWFAAGADAVIEAVGATIEEYGRKQPVVSADTPLSSQTTPPVVTADTHNSKDNSLGPKGPKSPQASKPEKRPTVSKTVIGGYVPGFDGREKAAKFWMAHQRADLVSNIEIIIEHFTSHHRAAGSRMADWPSAWQTWYSRSLRDRPMAAAPRVATVAGVTIEQWMYRLRAWHLGIPDDGVSLEVPKGFWDKRWGPSPTKGAKIPPEAESEFNRRFPAGRVAAR